MPTPTGPVHPDRPGTQLPTHQPGLDRNRISLYRHHRVPPCIQPSRRRSTQNDSGRAVVHDQQVTDTLTVPTNKIKTRTANPPSSATRTTEHTPPIGRISDGQQ